MKPTLVCLDFKSLVATRYYSKPDGRGFEKWEAVICKPEDQTSTFASEVEQFRKGPEKKKPTERAL